MKSGYNVLWTEHALSELQKTIEYLEHNFTDKEILKLIEKIESIVGLISHFPRLFTKSNKKKIYKVTILKYNTLYYRIQRDNVEIISFFSNRQNPSNLKI